jgi:peptide/nickel transport system substrate-binding protein
MQFLILLGARAVGLIVCVLAVLGMNATELHAEDRLVVGVTLEPPHLDPTAGAAAAIDEIVYANLFEGLTRIDENGTVQPALAGSWDISQDGRVYTFHLRNGVRFHDGSEFDSSDVAFSLKRAMAADSTNAQKRLFDPVAEVTTPDPLTAVITLKRPNGLFLWNMGWGDAVIVAPESADANKTQPVGTGPYQFARWVRGDSLQLVDFEDYWGEKASMAVVEFKIISDPSAQVAAMLAGDIDVFPNLGAPESLKRFENDPRFDVFVGTTEGETILVLNQRRPLFQDIRVRRAIAHAIDRKAVIDGAMFGYGTVIGSHFAPHNNAYVDLTGLYPYDPGKARALLKEAGHSGGIDLVMKLPPPSYARRGGEIIAAQLAEVGIRAEIVPVEWAQWLSDVFRNDHLFDLTIVSHTEPLDIDIYTRDDYYFGYSSGPLKAAMTEIANSNKEADRNRLYGEAQRIIADDAANVFLFQLAKHGVQRRGLKGMWQNSPIQANDVTRARWE